MKTSRLFISALAVMAGVLTATPAINAQEMVIVTRTEK